MTLTARGWPRRAARGHLTNAEVFTICVGGEAILNQRAPENTRCYSALTFKNTLSAAPSVAKWFN